MQRLYDQLAYIQVRASKLSTLLTYRNFLIAQKCQLRVGHKFTLNARLHFAKIVFMFAMAGGPLAITTAGNRIRHNPGASEFKTCKSTFRDVHSNSSGSLKNSHGGLRTITPLSEPLSATELGQKLLKELEDIVNQDQHFLYQALKKASHNDSAITFGQMLGAIRKDRERILAALETLQPQFDQLSGGYARFGELFGDLRRHIQINAEEHCPPCQNGDLNRRLGYILESRDQHDTQLYKFLYEYWGINRSFIAEFMVAMQVKGFSAMNVHVSDMVPRGHKKSFEDELSHLHGHESHRYMLNFEIDVISYDSLTDTYSWVEVKNPEKRIQDIRDPRIKRIIDRQQALDSLLEDIRTNPRLASWFHTNVELRFMIVGAGIEPAIAHELKTLYGIKVYDRSVESLNQDIIDHR